MPVMSELTWPQAMAERREPNVLHLMGEMLAHPSMGEASSFVFSSALTPRYHSLFGLQSLNELSGTAWRRLRHWLLLLPPCTFEVLCRLVGIARLSSGYTLKCCRLSYGELHPRRRRRQGGGKES